ncbi:ABC transporter permease [Staphylococcus devriesei]|uniref:ABC transporter permease n=1 Tax=Staphylococcus devriesei TaxID=586733 RepID=A0A2T4KGX2_9STAP|nr:FtsX-like permease family protein [Staphylococcus devriesei]PTE73065.1 ABC transporter permease [Staphylococcus devriesei]RIL74313.1 ABC transporter permease [Staphylococcus devriesei]WKU12805.1 FtsX-like permease family protein [Staphylococcus devriesei]
MSFSHIIWKNFQQNITHYAIYIFLLLLSIVLFYSFITIKYVHHLHLHQSMSVIKQGTQVGSYFLFIIIIVFIMYTNMLFIKRRSYEFGLLQTVGLNKKSIIYMLMLEQLFIFLITAILGMVIGILGSKILLMIVLKLLGIHTSVSIIFSFQAIAQTLFILIISYILIIVQAWIYLNKNSIKSLMSFQDTKEESKVNITLGEVVLGILGILFILAGYYLSTRFMELLDHILLPFIILFLTVIGAYFFFRSTVSLILKIIKYSKGGNVTVNDVIFTSSLMFRIRKNAFSLTVMAIISAITVSVLCFAALSRGSLSNEVLLESPHEVTLKDENIANELGFELGRHHIAYQYDFKEVVYSKVYKDHLFDVSQAQPYAVTVTSEKYFPNISLEEGQANLIIPEGLIHDLAKHRENGTIAIGTKKSHVNVKLHKVINKIYFKESIDLGGPTLVLSDKEYNYLKAHAKNKYIVPQYGFDLKHNKDIPKLEKIVSGISGDVQTRSEVVSEASSLTGILLFVTSFLGIAFLIATGCIIYIKQIDETEDELESYSILRKLGFTQKDMARGLKLKVAFNFGLPLIIALLHAYFASLVFMKLIGFANQTPIFVVMAIYTVIYSIFAIIAYNHSRRTINHSI